MVRAIFQSLMLLVVSYLLFHKKQPSLNENALDSPGWTDFECLCESSFLLSNRYTELWQKLDESMPVSGGDSPALQSCS